MIYVITGPTNTGKDRIAIELAKRLGGEIINADAFHIYRQLSIGTNKPKDEDFQGVKHHLFGFVDVTENYSIARYQKEARTIIDDLTAKQIPVILLGGSGLYIKAALFDYRFQNEKEVDMSRFTNLTNEELYRELQARDLETSREIHPNNRKRVTRALQIFLAQGTKKSEIPASQNDKPLYNALFFGIEFDRATLYLRIAERVKRMVSEGLFEEVANLTNQYGYHHQAFYAIGYKEAIAHVQGTISQQGAVETIIKNTRHYVKRQMTFVRHQFPMQWIKDTDDIMRIINHG